MRAIFTILLIACVCPAAAQPAEPVPAAPAEVRLMVGGELIATFGSQDPGFFNYATDEYKPLRNVRLIIDSSLVATRHIEILGRFRTDGGSNAQVSGLYIRLRPWVTRDVTLSAGRVPPTFGLYGRVGYGGDNALIGRPLAYGYLTSLRRDALPATVANLLQMRGRGWLSQFPVGNTSPHRGLPLIDADQWDTGIQARIAHGVIAWNGAVTLGSLAGPRVRDDNGGRMVSSRLTFTPHPAVAVGVSGARGAYLSRSLSAVLPTSASVDTFRQRAVGVDADVSFGRWQVRGEIIRSAWALPAPAGSPLAAALTSVAAWAEGRVRVYPGIDIAVRGERLTFGAIQGAARPTPWEAPVSRVEAGVSAALHRHVRGKLAYQLNRRPLGGRVRRAGLIAAQLSVWF